MLWYRCHNGIFAEISGRWLYCSVPHGYPCAYNNRYMSAIKNDDLVRSRLFMKFVQLYAVFGYLSIQQPRNISLRMFNHPTVRIWLQVIFIWSLAYNNTVQQYSAYNSTTAGPRLLYDWQTGQILQQMPQSSRWFCRKIMYLLQVTVVTPVL